MDIKSNLGLVHIYCGDGKGKTTAAIGLITRALGNKLNVILVQFLKNGKSSEIKFFEKLKNIKYFSNTDINKYSFNMNEKEQEIAKKNHEENFYKAIEICEKGFCDILVLDEIIGAINRGLFSEKLLLNWLNKKPKNIEVILTGRNPSEKLQQKADYISEIQKIKHPIDKGIKARLGIEK